MSRQRMPILKKQILGLSWTRLRPDKNVVSDFLINLFGFVPLGAVLMVVLGRTGRLPDRHAMIDRRGAVLFFQSIDRGRPGVDALTEQQFTRSGAEYLGGRRGRIRTGCECEFLIFNFELLIMDHLQKS